jgi:DNA (cytosine-5)-methyltransferase 1
MSLKYIDLFAGVGGFHLGIKNAHPDWECVYSNEWDKYANSVYRKHFGECDQRDIREVKAEELPDFDLLCGGFPCQSFSIAGKRGGFADTRGTLFFEIARIVKQKQPRLLLLENVKGLLSHDQGRTFTTIISTLDELGYDVQWQVLNSKNFGVPQNRERIIIIGHLRGTSRPEVFPLFGVGSKDIRKILDTGHDGTNIFDTSGIAVTQKALGGGQGAKTGLYAITRGRSTQPWKESDTAPTVRQSDKADVRAVLTPDRAKKRQNGRRMKDPGEPSFTLTSQDIHGVMFENPDNSYCLDANYYKGTSLKEYYKKKRRQLVANPQIRRLTPTECERLQGFPDQWTKFDADGNQVSDTQRYKMCGNAVTTNVVTAVVLKLV